VRLVWFAPFQPLPHGEPQPCAGASSIGVCTENFIRIDLLKEIA
jgi:hypothetical protein